MSTRRTPAFVAAAALVFLSAGAAFLFVRSDPRSCPVDTWFVRDGHRTACVRFVNPTDAPSRLERVDVISGSRTVERALIVGAGALGAVLVAAFAGRLGAMPDRRPRASR